MGLSIKNMDFGYFAKYVMLTIYTAILLGIFIISLAFTPHMINYVITSQPDISTFPTIAKVIYQYIILLPITVIVIGILASVYLVYKNSLDKVLDIIKSIDVAILVLIALSVGLLATAIIEANKTTQPWMLILIYGLLVVWPFLMYVLEINNIVNIVRGLP